MAALLYYCQSCFGMSGYLPMDETYKTPAGVATATLVEKKSEFIVVLAPAIDEDAAMDFLAGVRAQHRDANHNVWALRLREGGRERCSDDGEPAKTAGAPVLAVLAGAGLVNCILVVTRYFGGTLLGTGGLVRAYSGAASAAVAAAHIATVRPLCRFTVTLPYPLYDSAARLLADTGAAVEDTAFTDRVIITAVLPKAEAPALHATLANLLRGGDGIAISAPFHAPWPAE
uniref:Impact N-terminal domain-containing protein n=1 Tax=termite gut metagenome TaxID=433724 RepID=S0DDC8_9ZZZZ